MRCEAVLAWRDPRLQSSEVQASAGSWKLLLHFRDPDVAFVLGDGEEEPRAIGGELAPARGPLRIVEAHDHARCAAVGWHRPDAATGFGIRRLEIDCLPVARPDRGLGARLVRRGPPCDHP